MSKTSLLILCLILAFSLCACSVKNTSLTSNTEDATSASDVSEVDDAELECEHTFKEEVQKEAGYGVTGHKIKYCTKCHDIEHLEIPALDSIFELTATNKSVSKQENTGFVSFEIVIKNISDKKIETISGNLSVLAPDCILEISCDFENISLEPYSTITLDSYGYTFEFGNSDKSVEQKVYEASFEDMNFIFEASNVVVKE